MQLTFTENKIVIIACSVSLSERCGIVINIVALFVASVKISKNGRGAISVTIKLTRRN